MEMVEVEKASARKGLETNSLAVSRDILGRAIFGPAFFNAENLGNLILRARSDFNGFAGGDCEPFWSTEVLESMKSQTPSTKLQTNLKFQYQMTKTGLEF